MPTTYNGIGTHYYGKKNRSTRTAACGFCHRVGDLQSYDTRLWFVIVFIPVIPLGRKRIIDLCPNCQRHMAADADRYEQARQLQTSGSLERFRREPSPEAALEAHGQLLAFHEHEQAARFRATALERFPGHPGIRVGLASHLRQISSFDESVALYEDALVLDPDLPEARVGVALWKMNLGELDEAHRLLDFLEAPGAGQHYSLGPLDALSSCYQGQGRHEEALRIARHLLEEVPPAGQQHSFRSFVRKSEKALGEPETILPPRRHSLRGVFRAEGSPYAPWQRRSVLGAMGLGLLAAGLLINNEYIRRHRTIHVVNACGPPVQIRVDDGPPQAVAGLGRLTLAEGRHRVRMAGPVEETQEIDVQSGFFDRWFGSPAWVLNPGGEAVLEDITITYAAVPEPPVRRLIVGKPFFMLPRVDYAFEPPPQRLDVKSRTARVEKVALGWLQGQDAGAFLTIGQTDRAGALTFAERRLRRDPTQVDLLKYYLGTARAEERPRIEAFLKSGLDRRPISIPWHRAYQMVCESSGHDDGLVALYDRDLESEPSSGTLLYLRGRIDPDWDRQEAFYRRAVEADPRLPWPWLALGIRAMALARWGESLDCLQKARELQIGEDQVREAAYVARLAKGEAEALVIEERDRLVANPLDVATVVLLCDALAASGQVDRIEPELVAWANRLPADVRHVAVKPVRELALYQAGKVRECEEHCRGDNSPRAASLRAHALLCWGRAEEVAADGSFEGAWADPWSVLAVSLGLDLEGRAGEAARWRERAARALEGEGHEGKRVAKALGDAEPTPVADLERVFLEPREKALVFAVLGGRFPARRAEYLASAARFNVTRRPPYHLVRRAIEAAAAASSSP